VPAGCDGPVEPVALDVTGLAPAADYKHLAAVLETAVQEGGMVDPSALKRHAEALDAQLGLLAVTGPSATSELFHTPEDRLAYWYNARAAWAMKLVLLDNVPKRITERKLRSRPFPLDGRLMTLADIDAILSADEDWRTVVAAPGVCLLRAALPAVPFTAGDVRRRITRRLGEFIDDPDRFVIDVEHRRILIPPVLWRFRDRLIDAHNETYGTDGATLTTALLPLVGGSAHRRLQDAIGYRAVRARTTGLLARTK